ncbi:MAG: PAS domain S-box protein [Desulfobacteraceae bacterium]|nr:PAS domain S-box protein [Desulfobacteraceae bacterium]
MHGILIDVNDAYCRMTGYTKDQILGMSIGDLDDIESPEVTAERIERIIANGSEFFETQQRRRDGSVFPVEVSTTWLPIDGGRLVCFGRDITDRKQAEEALRKSEARFSLAMDATKDGIWDWDLTTGDIYCSPGLTSMLGYDSTDVIKKADDWQDLIHMEDRQKAYQANIDCVNNLTDSFEIEYRMKTSDGGWKWILGRGQAVYRDDSGRAVRMIGTHQDITERKRAEDALRKNEERIRLALDGTGDGYWDWNAKSGAIDIDPNWQRFLGYEPEEKEYKFDWWEKSIHPESVPVFDNALKAYLEGRAQYYELEYQLHTKSGEWKWIWARGKCIEYDAQGQPVRFIGTHRDITDRKWTEEALRESEARFKALHSASFGGIAIHDYGVILECNQGLSDMTGYEYSELIGMDGLLLIAEKSREEVMNNIRAGYEKPYEAFGLRKNGEEFPMRLEARNVPYKGKQVRITEFRDITDRKQAEMQLQKSEEQFRNLYDDAPIGYFEYDLRGNITRVNLTHSKLLGWKFIVDEAAREQILDKLRGVRPPAVGLERTYRRKDGTLFPVLFEDRLLTDEDGHITGIRTAIQDISERKQAEVKILHLQKSESLGRMAGAVAHHFNNQLSVVMGNLELVLDDLPADAENRENLFQSFEAGRKAAEVSQQMLRYLGHISGRQTTINLSDVCRQTLALLQSSLQNSVTLNVDFPDSGPIVRADTGQIQQVLTNLFTNAQESLHNNQGIIDLNIQTVSYEDIPVSNRFPLDWQPQDIPYACLKISDTGCGISKKDIVKLFDPFYTTKFTGRGMGLSVTMGFLKTHGGCISVDSEAGRGSIFRAYLPVTTEINSVKHEKVATPKENVGNSGTVLLIEDEASVRYMVKAMLTRLGYAVIEAQDGVEAVRLFQEHQNEIDCVLSDLTMPRMNGWETLTELRRMGADVPVILASGYDKESVMAGDHPELPQAFLNKPYSMAALKDVLVEVIRL